jgi:hypothetical protein
VSGNTWLASRVNVNNFFKARFTHSFHQSRSSLAVFLAPGDASAYPSSTRSGSPFSPRCKPGVEVLPEIYFFVSGVPDTCPNTVRALVTGTQIQRITNIRLSQSKDNEHDNLPVMSVVLESAAFALFAVRACPVYIQCPIGEPVGHQSSSTPQPASLTFFMREGL